MISSRARMEGWSLAYYGAAGANVFATADPGIGENDPNVRVLVDCNGPCPEGMRVPERNGPAKDPAPPVNPYWENPAEVPAPPGTHDDQLVAPK